MALRKDQNLLLVFFVFLSLSLSLSPPVWNMDAGFELLFFFVLLVLVSGSLSSSLSDLAAALRHICKHMYYSESTNRHAYRRALKTLPFFLLLVSGLSLFIWNMEAGSLFLGFRFSFTIYILFDIFMKQI